MSVREFRGRRLPPVILSFSRRKFEFEIFEGKVKFYKHVSKHENSILGQRFLLVDRPQDFRWKLVISGKIS